jgi:multidrug efflux pump subunit AcrA (membrane-fusion protein)
MDVVADVPEGQAGRLREGQRATIHVAAFPERVLEGRVVRIRHGVDRETRTVEAVVRVPNEGERLRDGMFAMVELRDSSAAGAVVTPAPAIPAAAVLSDGPERYVFVELGPGTFERRLVSVAAATNGSDGEARLAVLEGLRPGERIVGRGAFALKAELAKASFGDHH